MDYSMLLSPMKIGNLEIKNRTVMTAAEFSMGQANGKPTEKLMDYYEERAKGGVGLIIPGICRVNDMYATSSFTQLAMSHDYHIEPMREFVGRIHRHGAKLGIQLHHPGRQGYASSVNSLPMILPLVEKKPEIMEMLYKATPTMMALEENLRQEIDDLNNSRDGRSVLGFPTCGLRPYCPSPCRSFEGSIPT